MNLLLLNFIGFSRTIENLLKLFELFLRASRLFYLISLSALSCEICNYKYYEGVNSAESLWSKNFNDNGKFSDMRTEITSGSKKLNVQFDSNCSIYVKHFFWFYKKFHNRFKRNESLKFLIIYLLQRSAFRIIKMF